MTVLRAHAKLNLALSVGPPEPPKGYHPIASWFVAIDLHDTVTIERAQGVAHTEYAIRWAADAPMPTAIDWPVEKDLGARAHKLLEQWVGTRLPSLITIDKRIPVGGGLGGGSSDAACVLVGLNDTFELGISTTTLRDLSRKLGSDIAFFIDDERPPRPAIVSGYGERVERTARVESHGLLIIPPFGCPTGAVYATYDSLAATHLDMTRVRRLVSMPLRPDHLFNDLAAPACAVELRLLEWLTRVQRVVDPAIPIHITGSGSTMFALLPEADTPAVAAQVLATEPDARVVPIRIV